MRHPKDFGWLLVGCWGTHVMYYIHVHERGACETVLLEIFLTCDARDTF